MGHLYIVGLPIGNREDITLRALKILENVEYVLSEDTREFYRLAKIHNITTKARSYHAFNEINVAKILKDLSYNYDIALVADRGMPTICDPGVPLIRAYMDVLEQKNINIGLHIEVIPGASAITTFLPYVTTTQFHFGGFFSKKQLPNLTKLSTPVILYESPHRIKKTLKILQPLSHKILLGRELTKKFQEICWIKQSNDYKGEIVLGVWFINTSISKEQIYEVLQQHDLSPSVMRKITSKLLKMI